MLRTQTSTMVLMIAAASRHGSAKPIRPLLPAWRLPNSYIYVLRSVSKVSGFLESPVAGTTLVRNLQRGDDAMSTYKTIGSITALVRTYAAMFFSALASTSLLASAWGVIDAVPADMLPSLVKHLPQYLLVLLVFIMLTIMTLEFMKYLYPIQSPAKSILSRICKSVALLLAFVAIAAVFLASIGVTLFSASVLTGLALQAAGV